MNGILCINCSANPAKNATVHLRRINQIAIIGEWICTDCLESAELSEGEYNYIHAADCPNYCDYCCNGEYGFKLAEQINDHMR